MSDFKGTVSLIQKLIKFKKGDRETTGEVAGVSTNVRNLEIIKIFDKGECKVSSVTEVPKSVGGSTKYRFKVDFNTVHNEDVESIIEKFNEVFVFHSITEVGKN